MVGVRGKVRSKERTGSPWCWGSYLQRHCGDRSSSTSMERRDIASGTGPLYPTPWKDRPTKLLRCADTVSQSLSTTLGRSSSPCSHGEHHCFQFKVSVRDNSFVRPHSPVMVRFSCAKDGFTPGYPGLSTQKEDVPLETRRSRVDVRVPARHSQPHPLPGCRGLGSNGVCHDGRANRSLRQWQNESME